jgi:hypothetical protein
MALLLCSTSALAGAQTKISGKLACPQPTVNQTGGDREQVLMFTKTNCTWSAPMMIAGSKTTTAVDVEIGEINGATGRGQGHGFSASVMDNGDTTVTRYEGTVMAKKDGSASFSGTWRFVRGTGKFAGISGGGTYKGTGNNDGGTIDIAGHYAIGKGQAKKAM